MIARWVRLWFGFRDPVDRGTYFRHGAGLMALKYAIDAFLIWRFAGRVWTPLNYLSPLLSTRTELLRGAPPWLIPVLVAIALPFLWIGVSMSMRRAVDAGASPWIALLFFVPALNFVLMAVLSLLPSQSTIEWPVEPPPPAVDDRLKSAMLGVAAASASRWPRSALGFTCVAATRRACSSACRSRSATSARTSTTTAPNGPPVSRS